MQQSKKRKVMFFLDFEEKNVKNVFLKNLKVMTCRVLETTQSVFVL